MSRGELKNLAELGSNSRVQHRTTETKVGDPHASDIQELQEKLQMAQEELELVRAGLAGKLEQVQRVASEETATLAEQLEQAQQTTEAASEESAE